MLFFIKKSKVLALLFLLIMFLYAFPVDISQAVESSSNSIGKYISVENSIEGSRFKVGEEFKITYKVDGDDIPKDVIIGEENSKKKEIVLVIDTSGSMEYDIDGNKVYGNKETRLDIVKGAVKNFIDKLTKDGKKFVGSDNISIALVSYSDYAIAEKYPPGFSKNYDNEYFATLTEIKDYNKLSNSFINSLRADGGTNIGDGIRKAYYLLKDYGHDDAEKYIVLMTDGEPTSFSFDSIDSENSYNLIGLIKEKNRKINSEYNYWGDIDSVDYFIENEFNPKNYGYFSSNVNYQIDYKEFGLTYSSKIANMIANDDINIHTFIIGFSNGINEDKLNTINEDVGGSYWEAKTEDALNDVYEKIAEHISTSIVLDDVIFNQKLPQGIEVIGTDNNYVNKNTFKKEIRDIVYKYNSNNDKYEIESLSFEIKYKGTSPGDFTLEDSSISFTDINGNEEMKYFLDLSLSIIDNKPNAEIIKHGIFVNKNSKNSIQNYLDRPSDNIVNIINGYNIKMGVIFKCNSIDIDKYEMSIVLNNFSASNVTTKIKNIFSYRIDNDNSLHGVNNVENLRINGNRYIFDYKNDKNYDHYMIVYEYFVKTDNTVDYASLTLSNDVILYNAIDSIDIKIVDLPSID